MEYRLFNNLLWVPRTLSLVIILVWLVALLVIYGLGPYFILGIMLWLLIILTTAVAWKNDPFGGALFLIIGFMYLIFASGNGFSLSYIMGAAPFFITGSMFLFTYFYQEKKEAEDMESDF